MVDVTDLLLWIPDLFVRVIANYYLLHNDMKISRPYYTADRWASSWVTINLNILGTTSLC